MTATNYFLVYRIYAHKARCEWRWQLTVQHHKGKEKTNDSLVTWWELMSGSEMQNLNLFLLKIALKRLSDNIIEKSYECVQVKLTLWEKKEWMLWKGNFKSSNRKYVYTLLEKGMWLLIWMDVIVITFYSNIYFPFQSSEYVTQILVLWVIFK